LLELCLLGDEIYDTIGICGGSSEVDADGKGVVVNHVTGKEVDVREWFAGSAALEVRSTE